MFFSFLCFFFVVWLAAVEEPRTESSKVELQALGGCLSDEISFLDSQKFVSSDDRDIYDRRLPAFGGKRKNLCLGEVIHDAVCMKIRSLQVNTYTHACTHKILFICC